MDRDYDVASEPSTVGTVLKQCNDLLEIYDSLCNELSHQVSLQTLANFVIVIQLSRQFYITLVEHCFSSCNVLGSCRRRSSSNRFHGMTTKLSTENWR